MTLQAQILFKVEMLEDESGWGIYAKLDDINVDISNNIDFNSGQVSMLVSPGFEVKNIKNINGFWRNHQQISTPIENPDFDYIDIGFTVNDNFPNEEFLKNEEVLLFTFEPNDDCPNVLKLMNLGDPFYQPNSFGTNSGNDFILIDITNQTTYYWTENYQDCPDICSACATNTSNLSETVISNNIKIAPNPSNGNFDINLGKIFKEVDKISIVNNLGQLIFETKKIVSENQISIDIPNGIYNISFLQRDKSIITKRIIISN